MEIQFPIEFVVKGTPISLQAKRAASRDEWKARVKEASKTAIPDSHLASNDRMSVTLFYLPEEEMEGDIDNIVKPVLDALCKHIYLDDHQVERLLVKNLNQVMYLALERLLLYSRPRLSRKSPCSTCVFRMRLSRI